MKITIKAEINFSQSEKLARLIKERIELILYKKCLSIIDDIIFDDIPEPFIITNKDDNKYIVYFSGNVLTNMLQPGDGLVEFDKYIQEIENRLVLQI